MIPESVPEKDRHRLRQFYRLLLSYSDFKHAKLVAQHILDEDMHASFHGPMATLLEALNCSMVMAYCRPFSGNAGSRGTSIPDLPAGFLKLLTDDEREIHLTALHDRNKYLAHTDGEASELGPVRLKITDTHEVLMPLAVDRLAPLNEQATSLLLSASTKLLHAVVERRLEMEADLAKYFPEAGPDTLFQVPDQ